VRLIRVEKEELLFKLTPGERLLLIELLKDYPPALSAYSPVSKLKQLPDQATAQRLLEEALAEQRAENKKLLDVLGKDANRWKEEPTHWLLGLSKGDLEWILQILNDIGVGNWTLLGSPENWSDTISLEKAPGLWAMELAGAFQMEFLQALDRRKGSKQ